MEFAERVEQLVAQHLTTRPDLFLIDLKISPDSKVVVTIDGDRSVCLQDCLDMSRAVEFNLDRDEHDFSLQVTSADITQPLQLPRQYRKNIGRKLDVLLTGDQRISGELKEVHDDHIIVEMRYRRPKEHGKGKENVIENKVIPFSEIKKTVLVLKY